MGIARTVRRIYSTAMTRSGLAALQRWRLRRRVVIMTYHDVDAAVFASHLAFLAGAYRIVPLADAVRWLRGEADLPERALAITFDDGFRSFYTDVYPVLQRYRAPATVFLTTGYIGSDDILWFNWVDLALSSGAALPDALPASLRGLQGRQLRRRLMPYLKSAPDDERLEIVQLLRERTSVSPEQVARHRLMTWHDAREMQASGLVSLGGHTRSHPILSRAGLAKAEAEKISLTGNAEAEKILAIGKSNAESYKLSVEAMGGDNFTQLKVIESIAAEKVKIMPDVLIGGGDGANGGISGLLGLQLLEKLGKKVSS